MKLNSKKKNSSGKFWKSIFFILVFSLLFYFFGDLIEKKINNLREAYLFYKKNKKEIIQENLKLKKEIEESKLKNIFANYYYNRTQELEKRLDFQENRNIERKLFRVIYSNKISDSFILNSNKDSILEKNKKVYFSGNFVLGKIISSDNFSARVRMFSSLNYKNNFAIISNGEIIFRGEGIGDSNGIIKIILPRKLAIPEKSVLILDDGSGDIVARFLKDDFKIQDTEREVYFKIIKNPNTILEVEI